MATRNFFFNPNPCIGPCAQHAVFPTTCGSLLVWGNNDKGQLGLGHNVTHGEVYERILPNNEQAVSSACGFDHTMIVTQNGLLFAVGSNNYGKLGLGYYLHNQPYCPSPQFVLENVSSVACGKEFSVALLNDGNLMSVGNNEHGQLGVAQYYAFSHNFVRVNLFQRVQKVCCGEDFAMALTKTGEVYVWGQNDSGQLGLGDTRSRNVPKKNETSVGL